jgi:hypothetical protein
MALVAVNIIFPLSFPGIVLASGIEVATLQF